MQMNSMEAVPLIMIIGGGVLYHVCQKATPTTLSPFLVLGISFGLASLACLGLLATREGINAAQLHRVNWTSITLALALVMIESGYLIGYRAGLKLNITSFVCNGVIAIVLLVVGTFYYRESFTLRTGSGLVLCLVGLLLMLR